MTQAANTEQVPIAIQGELAQRILAIDLHAARASTATMASEVDAIRRIAQSNGLYPAAAVAHALEMALGRGERGPLIHGWLAILRDAVGSERHDRAACETYTAACSVRFSG